MAKTILIVDDNPDGIMLTEMAVSMLEMDIRTESASSGEAALDFLRKTEKAPALILLDVKMPGMGGIETLKTIRADDRLKDIPVIMVTHSTLHSDAVAAMAAGASDYLQKPIRLDEFNRELKRCVMRWLL